MKHIVSVTYSDPGHEFMSMKGRTKSTNYVVEARNPSEAQLRASSYFRSMGYKIHSAVVNEQKKEEPKTENLSEASTHMAHFKLKADSPSQDRIAIHADSDDAKAAHKKFSKVFGKSIAKHYELDKMEPKATNEETQYIEEKLKASDGAAKWIHDFVHSDNPKFEGKSKKERIQQALGAYYAAKREGSTNEEMKPYVKAAQAKFDAQSKAQNQKPVQAGTLAAKARREGQVAQVTEDADQPDPSNILGVIKAAAKSKTLAKQASPKIELGLSKDNPVNEKGPKDEDITEAAELPSEEGKSDKKAALNKKVDASEKDTEVAKAKDKVLKGKKNKVVMHPQKDNVPHVVLPFNPLVGNAPGGGV